MAMLMLTNSRGETQYFSGHFENMPKCAEISWSGFQKLTEICRKFHKKSPFPWKNEYLTDDAQFDKNATAMKLWIRLVANDAADVCDAAAAD